MKPKSATKLMIILMFLALFFTTGICVGNYQGYTRGYKDGQKETNSWWIDKQSRYYDSMEVEKKRHNLEYDRI